MKKATYTERKTLVKYDDNRYMAYLNEEVIDDYVPDTMEEEPTPEPTTGYAYTGTEPDGGTLITASSADRDSLINGIIRSRYTQTEEDAIKTHQIELLRSGDHVKADDYNAEWEAFNAFRLSAISTVDRWLE
ncbi:MAG: hypothetical protein NC131_08785 [Roseburia sp.]|nr:hypothetical protein [Roseburia sp.]